MTPHQINRALQNHVTQPNLCLPLTIAMDVQAAFSQLSSISAQKDKSTAYSELLQTILNQPQTEIPAALLTYVGLVVNRDQPGIVVARQVLAEIVEALGKNRIEDRDARKKVIEDVLETLQPRLVSYEEQVSHKTYYYE
jgi:COP9 signalosome complex subunit 4